MNKQGGLMNTELIKALKEDAEWAHANEWETPITLGDHLDAAADALEAAEKREEAQRWIPVGGRLPEVDESGDVDVLVHMDDGFIATCTYDRNASHIASDCWLLWRDAGNVTHWMPLPDPPRKDDEA